MNLTHLNLVASLMNKIKYREPPINLVENFPERSKWISLNGFVFSVPIKLSLWCNDLLVAHVSQWKLSSRFGSLI
jgi:hypothetical protein